MAIIRAWAGNGLAAGALTTSSAGAGDNAFASIQGAPTIVAAGSRPPSIEMSGVQQSARWTYAARTIGAIRLYFTTPSAWASASAPIAGTIDGTTLSVNMALGGTGSPGQLRLRNGTTVLAQTDTGVLALATTYRLEIIFNHGAGVAVARIFAGDSTTQIAPELHSGNGAPLTTSYSSVFFGPIDAAPTMGAIRYDDMAVSDADQWIGPAVTPGVDATVTAPAVPVAATAVVPSPVITKAVSGAGPIPIEVRALTPEILSHASAGGAGAVSITAALIPPTVTVAQDASATAPAASITTTAPPPVAARPVTATPPAVTASLSARAPAVSTSGPAVVAAPVIATAVAMVTPAVAGGAVAAAPMVTIQTVARGGEPGVTASVAIGAPAVAAAVDMPSPLVLVDGSVVLPVTTAGVGAQTPAPSITTGTTLASPPIAVFAAVLVAEILAGRSAIVEAPAVIADAYPYAPTVATDASLAAPSASATATVPAPAVATSRTAVVLAAAVDMLVTAFAPRVASLLPDARVLTIPRESGALRYDPKLVSTWRHDPQAYLDYHWDWSDWLAGDVITTATVTAIVDSDRDPADSAQVDAQAYGRTSVTAWVTGGVPGVRTGLVCRITTAAGRTDDRTIWLQVRQR